MSTSRDDARRFLYDLLPRYVRYQDQESGQALEALMEVLESEFRRLHDNMGQLYEDWFIETCQPQLMPLLGELVGLDLSGDPWKTHVPLRPLVAKAIGRRRYKGTAESLAHAVEDATGWGALAVEQREVLGWSQDVRAALPGRVGFLDLRGPADLEVLGTPFDRAPRTVGVRRPAPSPLRAPTLAAGGLYNLQSIAVYVWRLSVHKVWRGAPRRVAAGCYTLDPFGQDVPLFAEPNRRLLEGVKTTPTDLPIEVGRELLEDLLGHLRRLEHPGQESQAQVRSWLQLYDLETESLIPLETVAAWDLEHWRRPTGEDTFEVEGEDGVRRTLPVLAAVDPELGRVTLQQDLGEHLQVTYCYGSSTDVGGGPYPRRRLARRPGIWRAIVVTDPVQISSDYVGPPVFEDLQAALQAWPADQPRAALRLLGSGRLDAPKGVWRIDLRKDRESLTLEAAEGSRPFLSGHLVAHGRDVSRGRRTDSRSLWPHLRLDGVWLDGSFGLTGGLRVEIDDCTLGPPLARTSGRGDDKTSMPRAGGALRAREPLFASVDVRSSILGPVRLPPTGVTLSAWDSVIDGGLWQGDGAVALAGLGEDDYGPGLELQRTTVLGALRATSLEALDVFFCRRPEVERAGLGGLHHCFVPPAEGERAPSLPPGEHLLPPESGDPGRPAAGWAGAGSPENWLVSVTYGDPGYSQLTAAAPTLLETGGTQGSAVGLGHRLYAAERMARLPALFEDCLRWGYQAQVVLTDGGRYHGPLTHPEDVR